MEVKENGDLPQNTKHIQDSKYNLEEKASKGKASQDSHNIEQSNEVQIDEAITFKDLTMIPEEKEVTSSTDPANEECLAAELHQEVKEVGNFDPQDI